MRRQALSGLGWTSASRVFQQAVQFVFTAVLAHLLVPRDFGLIAMIAVFTGFIFIFTDLGLSAAIVQRRDVGERHLCTALWLNAGLGVGSMLAIMGIAPALAAFYGQPRLVALTVALAPTSLIGSLAAVQTAILERQMDFKRLAIIESTAFVAGNVLAIAMAAAGYGVWSFVGLALLSSSIRAVLLWGFSGWRPRHGPDRQSLADLWGFGSRLTGFNTVNYLARNVDNLLIGRFVGTNQLAYYNQAYNFMLFPVGLVGSVATRVMFPALSRLQDDVEQVKRVYLRSLGLISLLTFPFVVGLFVVAQPLVLTLLGPRWRPAVPLVQILCIPSLVQSLVTTTGWIFTSQGRTDMMLRWGLFASSCVICSFFVGLPWGARGVAIAYAAASVIGTYPSFAYPGRLIGLSMMDVVRSVSGVIPAVAIMGGAAWAVERWSSSRWGSGYQLALAALAGVVTYVLALELTSPKPYREFRRLWRSSAERLVI